MSHLWGKSKGLLEQEEGRLHGLGKRKKKLPIGTNYDQFWRMSPVYLWRICYSAAFGWSVQWTPVKTIFSNVSLMVDVFWFCLNDSFIDKSVYNVPLLLHNCLSLYICSDLFYICRCSYVECLNIYRCYILLLTGPLYCCVIPFFSQYSHFKMKTYT